MRNSFYVILTGVVFLFVGIAADAAPVVIFSLVIIGCGTWLMDREDVYGS